MTLGIEVRRAVVGLPVSGPASPSLDNCLEHLVAAADEAAAAGVPTVLVLVGVTPEGESGAAELLDVWAPLVAVVDDVTVVQALDHSSGLAGADAAVEDAGATLLLTTASGVRVRPDWVLEHLRHHRAGALATTAPVRSRSPADPAGPAGPELAHLIEANLAVRASLYRRAGAAPADWPLQFALTPVVDLAAVTPRVRSAGPH